MLVLNRKIGEKVIIAEGEIVIQVVEVRGDRVKLGFEADPSIPIDREEIHKQKIAA